MSVIQGLAQTSSSGYTIDKSVRFRSSASAYFSRTFGTPTNNKKWTWSAWVKRGALGTQQYLMHSRDAGNTVSWELFFQTDNTLIARNYNGSGFDTNYVTTQVFRDPTAHMHVLVIWDSDNATQADRQQIWINGSRITSFSTYNQATGGNSSIWNVSGYSHFQGALYGTASYFDGLLSDIYFIDGQALTPSSFGEQNTDGVWVPKQYSGTYGNNGFYLKFADQSAATAAAIGKDSSGNGNNWTPSGIYLTTSTNVQWDGMADTPTANYATLNPLAKYSGLTASDGNITSTHANTYWNNIAGSIAVSSGKWYWEATLSTLGSGAAIGVAKESFNWFAYAGASASFLGYPADGWAYHYNALKYNNNASSSYGATFTTNDVIGVALDLDAGTLTFYKNGVSQGQAYSGLSGTFMAGFCGYDGAVWKLNFGQRPFTYSNYGVDRPASTFKALCTSNLPAVAITKPKAHFDVDVYSGTVGVNTRTGFAFQPDLVWGKARNVAAAHRIVDAVRGGTLKLTSNTTDVQSTDVAAVTFNSDGYTMAAGNHNNDSATTYVSWLWKANGSGVTGSGTSLTNITYSANPTAGFSIVKYTGSASNGSFTHGLNAVPKMIIVKAINEGTNEWVVYHVSIGNTNALRLNLTNAPIVSGAWNNTTPDQTYVYTGGGSLSSLNGSTNHIAYCFAEIAGYSKFGSYVGNNSADGPYVHCGFRPRYVLIKSSTLGSEGWFIIDAARDTYNVMTQKLGANYSVAENDAATIGTNTQNLLDFTASGFKLRTSTSGTNSANTFIFAAFAEYPFGGSNVAPAPAR